jgi:serine-type D-Ala-D-Ala carboxypeptidase/endopeptidase (penicillin-binding protein 4)
MIHRLRKLSILSVLTAAILMLVQRSMAAGDLDALFDSLTESNGLRGASWSILAYSLNGDSVLYEKDADRLLTPASVTKLMTSAAALDALGEDYRFTTIFRAASSVQSDGTLDGDLIVDAGGDPFAEEKAADSLHMPVLRFVASSLAAQGLRRITGDLVMRSWPYRLECAAPAWELNDIHGGFAPAVDGFGFNNNVCNAAILPGDSVGALARFTLDPPYAPVHFRTQVHTSRAGSESWIEFEVIPADTSVLIAGEIPANDNGQYLYVPVQDPSLYYGRALAAALSKQGIELDGRVVVDRSGAGGASAVLYSYTSLPLTDALRLMNKESDNYAAEYVLHALGRGAGNGATRRDGLAAVMKFLTKAGVDKKEVNVEDGCGLARQNIVSARAIVKVLRAMFHHPAYETFRSTLSISGKDGTLSGRMGNDLAGRVFGKTGTMTHVSALAGYTTDDRGQPLAFAILCNNFRTTVPHVRFVQDRLVERFVHVQSEPH